MDFYGYEFDWYAVDQEGHIGVFSTAGFGLIPEAVQLHYQYHLDISDQIHQPRIGTPDVWKDFSNQGLFVFDWKHYNGPYLKVEEPTGIISDDLRTKILEVKGLPKIARNFKNELRIEENNI